MSKYKLILIAAGILMFLFVLLFKRSHHEKGQEVLAQTKSTQGILQDSEIETLRALSADVQALSEQNQQLQKSVEVQQYQTQEKLQTLEKQLQEENRKTTAEKENPSQPLSRWITIEDKGPRQINTPAPSSSETKSEKKENPIKPAYTLPIGTKLLNATTFDVLIGRIPIKGKVVDPYPFSVILSGTNLAANGHRIPGIKQAIATGTVVGDFNLTCARADIYTFTFVFDDGTISQTEGKKLGYLTNNKGAGCIAGTFVSDALKYIAGHIAMSSAQGAASALSESQVTQTSSGYQNESFISGSTGKFMLGEGVNAGMNESKKWLNDRLESSFDAIVVPQGQTVHITLTDTILIDYNPQGRKVNHDYSTASLHYPLD